MLDYLKKLYTGQSLKVQCRLFTNFIHETAELANAGKIVDRIWNSQTVASLPSAEP